MPKVAGTVSEEGDIDDYITGAEVKFIDQGSGSVVATDVSSGNRGAYSANVPEGHYEAVVTHEDYETYTTDLDDENRIVVTGEEEVQTANFFLKPANPPSGCLSF